MSVFSISVQYRAWMVIGVVAIIHIYLPAHPHVQRLGKLPMTEKMKLIARKISVAEARARRKELRETYYQVRLMLGDTTQAAQRNADTLLQRSLATGVIVEVARNFGE